MTEIMQVIAEAEGVRTPKRKRTSKELEAIVTNFKEKRAKQKKPGSAKAAKSQAQIKKESAVKTQPKTPPTFVEPIEMNHISPTGYVREAAFDAKNKMFHIGFAKSVWAMPSTPEAWATFEKAVADPTTDIDAFYRKEYRGRTADMLPVRKTAKGQEVSA